MILYSLSNYALEDKVNMAWSIPLTIGLVALAVYMPAKNFKDKMEFYIEKSRTESGKINKLFWELHKACGVPDNYVKKYTDIIDV